MRTCLLGVVALLVFSATELCAGVAITEEYFVGGSAVGQSFTPSNNVTVWADVHPSNGYILFSWHSSGNRQFGVDDGSSKIYRRDTTDNTTKSLADHISGSYVWPAPWQSL